MAVRVTHLQYLSSKISSKMITLQLDCLDFEHGCMDLEHLCLNLSRLLYFEA